MQLLVLSDTLAGGMGALARAHASWFAARGWPVALAAPLDGSRPDAPVRFVELPPVRTIRRPGEMRRARAALRAVRGEFGHDCVVHAHGMRAFVLARAAGLPKPFVSVHGTHPADDDPPGYAVLRRAWFALLPRLSRGALSGEPTSAAGWTYRPFASPLLARLDRLPFPTADATPTVAWLGLFDDRKHPDVFVRAVARLAREGVAVRGVMGGDGPRLHEITRLIAELDAPVELRGQTDPVPLLREAWALALFSGSEGTPLAVIEAMWAGRSVVASPLPGNRHLIGDTGALTADDDAAVQALRMLLTDHGVAASRGESAAVRVRTLLTADTPWAELEEMYRR